MAGSQSETFVPKMTEMLLCNLRMPEMTVKGTADKQAKLRSHLASAAVECCGMPTPLLDVSILGPASEESAGIIFIHLDHCCLIVVCPVLSLRSSICVHLKQGLFQGAAIIMTRTRATHCN